MSKEELKKKTNCELINLILEIEPDIPKCKLWTSKKARLINYYIKIKGSSK